LDKITIRGERSGLISRLLKPIIEKQLGCDVDIQPFNMTAATSGGKLSVYLDATVKINEKDVGRMKMKLGEMGIKVVSYSRIGRMIAEKLIKQYTKCDVDIERLNVTTTESEGKFIVNLDANVNLDENDLRNIIIRIGGNL
jgi:ABC-type proline/glycine betaine transport system substrate-binding protein